MRGCLYVSFYNCIRTGECNLPTVLFWNSRLNWMNYLHNAKTIFIISSIMYISKVTVIDAPLISTSKPKKLEKGMRSASKQRGKYYIIHPPFTWKLHYNLVYNQGFRRKLPVADRLNINFHNGCVTAGAIHLSTTYQKLIWFNYPNSNSDYIEMKSERLSNKIFDVLLEHEERSRVEVTLTNRYHA